VNVEIPEAGIMETDWAENRAKLPQDVIRGTLGKVFDSLYSTAERDKFRTRLEKSAETGMVEIYISHRGMYEVYTNEGKTDTRWQPRPADPELEAEMLRRLMVRLGVEESRAKTMMAGEQRQDRAKLSRATDGAGALLLEEAFDRAWRRVGLALDRVGFTVEDRDRSQGLYFVRYVDPEVDGKKKDEDKGFISKLMFWKEAAATSRARLNTAFTSSGRRGHHGPGADPRRGRGQVRDIEADSWPAVRPVEVSRSRDRRALRLARQRQPGQCLAGRSRKYPGAGRCRLRTARNLAPAGTLESGGRGCRCGTGHA
jgi:hypothetical protein